MSATPTPPGIHALARDGLGTGLNCDFVECGCGGGLCKFSFRDAPVGGRGKELVDLECAVDKSFEVAGRDSECVVDRPDASPNHDALCERCGKGCEIVSNVHKGAAVADQSWLRVEACGGGGSSGLAFSTGRRN